MKIEVIDALRTVARNLTNDILQHLPVKHGRAYNDFRNGVSHQLPHYYTEGKELKCTPGSQYAVIVFKNVRLTEIEDLKLSDPVEVNKVVNPVKINQWKNQSASPMTRQLRHATTKTVTELHTTTIEFGQEIEHALRSKVGGNIMIADVEMEQSLRVQLNFMQRLEKSKEVSESQEREETVEIEIPEYTETSVMQTNIITDWHRTTEAIGVLDAGIYIGSHGDWDIEVESLKQLESFFRGDAVPNQDPFLSNHFRSRKYQNYEIDISPLKVRVKNTFTARDLHVSNVDRIDVALPKPKAEKLSQDSLKAYSNEQILIEAYRRDLL